MVYLYTLYLFMREREHARAGVGAEGEGQADSSLSVERPSPLTQDSEMETWAEVRWATQVALLFLFKNTITVVMIMAGSLWL